MFFFFFLMQSTEKYEAEAFIPWFVISMFFMFMSVMGSALASDLNITVAVVIWRAIFLCFVWISYERWGEEEDDEEDGEEDDEIIEPSRVKVMKEENGKK